MKRAIVVRAVAALLLAIGTVAALFWVAPNFAGVRTATPKGPGVPGTMWTDGTRGGHWLHQRGWCWEAIDLRRIIFAGTVNELPYFNRDAPPAWAASVSLDLREGFEEVITISTGWPWRAMRGERWIRWQGPVDPQIVTAADGSILRIIVPPRPPPWEMKSLRLDPDAPHGWTFCLDPIWPGLLGDLGVAFAAWSLLLLAPIAWRTWRRHAKQQCLRCGYSRAGLAPNAECPECGAR